MANTVPDWVTYPEADWQSLTPEEAGLDPARFQAFIDSLDIRGASFLGEDHTNGKFGAVIARGGYLVHTWGDRHYRHQTASVGKAFTRALAGFAVADGLIDPDRPIHESWTGEGQLSHRHKLLTEGHHRTLTWRHLLGGRRERAQYGGFPMEMGIRWSQKLTGLRKEDIVPGVVPWAEWTGDAFYDLYSHAEPGTQAHYSSAGFWRLGQALTAVFGRDLQDVLQERLFDTLGIPPERWEWLSGATIRDATYLYPDLADSYTYLDPPYEIAGQPVRSGPGWVVISASDLARFGHLNATDGIWNGQRVIEPEWLRGHSGGNRCGVAGESTHFTALAVVTAETFDHTFSVETRSFLPEEVFVGPVRVAG